MDEYKIISASTEDMLEQRICDYLSLGWKLYQDLIIFDHPRTGVTFYQAMIK